MLRPLDSFSFSSIRLSNELLYAFFVCYCFGYVLSFSPFTLVNVSHAILY